MPDPIEPSGSAEAPQLGRGSGHHARPTATELLAIVRDGDDAARFAVASEEHMPEEAMLLLAASAEPGIRGSLLANPAVPTHVLQRMVEAYPAMGSYVAVHPNAPLDLMGAALLREHTPLSLMSYARRRGGTDERRDALLALHTEPLDTTLEDAWERTRP